MSVKVRPYKGKSRGWEVDVRVMLPDGSNVRERKRAPVSSKSAAKRWGEARERTLALHGPRKPRKEAPTLEEFGPRFLDSYAKANRQKPSGVAAKETILRVHLEPILGKETKLDHITNEDVQRIKSSLSGKAPKTVNNVLTVLNRLLGVAVEWKVIDQLPCTIKLLPVEASDASFHDFDEYARLIEASRSDPQAYLIVLLGGESGLRCGEMMALEWTDVDLSRRQLSIRRAEWKGKVSAERVNNIETPASCI